MKQKNLLTSYPFLSIIILVLMAAVPAAQKARLDKLPAPDVVLAVLAAVTAGAGSIFGIYNSSEVKYYTNNSLPGRNKQEEPEQSDNSNF